MNVYRPNRRDELTRRFARTLAECDRNPWSYSEGPKEPQRLVEEEPDDPVDRLLGSPWAGVAFVLLLLAIILGWLG